MDLPCNFRHRLWKDEYPHHDGAAQVASHLSLHLGHHAGVSPMSPMWMVRSAPAATAVKLANAPVFEGVVTAALARPFRTGRTLSLMEILCSHLFIPCGHP